MDVSYTSLDITMDQEILQHVLTGDTKVKHIGIREHDMWMGNWSETERFIHVVSGLRMRSGVLSLSTIGDLPCIAQYIIVINQTLRLPLSYSQTSWMCCDVVITSDEFTTYDILDSTNFEMYIPVRCQYHLLIICCPHNVAFVITSVHSLLFRAQHIIFDDPDSVRIWPVGFNLSLP